MSDVWTAASNGLPADGAEVSSFVGSGHCNYESIVALTLNGGETIDTPGDGFVSGPEGVLARIIEGFGGHQPLDKMFEGWADAQRNFDAHARSRRTPSTPATAAAESGCG